MALKKLADTSLYPHMVTLINAVGKTLQAKQSPNAGAFKSAAEGWISEHKNILQFPIVGNEDDETPKWYDEFMLALANNFTAVDFIKHRTLGIALSNFIVCYESIKKPKPWEELLFVDISEVVDGFDDFVTIRDDEDSLAPSGDLDFEEDEELLDEDSDLSDDSESDEDNVND